MLREEFREEAATPDLPPEDEHFCPGATLETAGLLVRSELPFLGEAVSVVAKSLPLLPGRVRPGLTCPTLLVDFSASGTLCRSEAPDIEPTGETRTCDSPVKKEARNKSPQNKRYQLKCLEPRK